MTKHLEITVYGRHSELTIRFPALWTICQGCEGNGTTSRHIECDGGGFTASEFNEICDEDEDFAEDYFSGAYDRACDGCDGKGRVLTIAAEEALDWRQKIFLKVYHRQLEDAAHDARVSYYERRAGA